jgi:hypothetical protein
MASATDVGQESEQIKSVDAVCYPLAAGYDIRRFLVVEHYGKPTALSYRRERIPLSASQRNRHHELPCRYRSLELQTMLIVSDM